MLDTIINTRTYTYISSRNPTNPNLYTIKLKKPCYILSCQRLFVESRSKFSRLYNPRKCGRVICISLLPSVTNTEYHMCLNFILKKPYLEIKINIVIILIYKVVENLSYRHKIFFSEI